MPVSEFQLGKAITQWIKNQVNTDQGQQQASQRITEGKVDLDQVIFSVSRLYFYTKP
ncbi:MAG: hypothetical protein QGI86_23115 [Candidatus Poribacteria bacterium]|jgi:hypothetical protein|nr:hypothetical protein [Candidatus Poribacteria bacterium]MDP6748402.1 hypothetical protein [Candidatus Poribacteria bacterium]MDP6996328.1 hypothetical protein [Candidatus Poribacteria bacterium]